MSRTIGKYRVLKSLAAGGMAEIFLAKLRGPEGFEKLVVVKQVLPHLVKNSDFVRMFLDEARLAAQLSHPNIVQIFELGVDAPTGSYFIAMEYIHGENLRQLGKEAVTRQQQIPMEFAAKIIGQAAEGLYYAHTKTDPSGKPLNVVHRDISPQNLILSFDGLCKIVDFGIAKASTQLVETQAGVLKGKYAYMSPEQCRGFPLDGRSDLFALGICLWELITGKGLYRQSNELMIMRAIVEETPPPPSSVRPDVPPALDAIVNKALAKKPKDRFQDGMELSYAIEEYLRDQRRMVSTVHLGAFMRALFAEKLEAWAKIQESLGKGDLEAELFEEVASEVVGGGFRVGTTPSQQHGGGRLRPDTNVGPRSAPTQARAVGATPAPLPAGGGRLEAAGARPLTDIGNTPAPRVGSSPNLARTPSQRSAVGLPALDVGPRGLPTPPPPPQKSKLPVVIGALGAVIVLGAGAFFGLKALQPPEGAVGPATGGTQVTPPAPKTPASLWVTSSPELAQVEIDGRKKCTTPCKVEGVEADRKSLVEVRLAGYEPYTTELTLKPGEEARLAVPPLKKLPGTATPPPVLAVTAQVESTPSGARVKLDGAPKGKTPLKLEGLQSGKTYKLEVELAGYQDATRDLVAGTDNQVSVKLERRGGSVAAVTQRDPPKEKEKDGTLVLTASDGKAALFVDGKRVGAGSSQLTVSPGAHRVKAVGAGGEVEVAVDVGAGATVRQTLKVPAATAAATAGGATEPAGAAKPGKLAFIISPWAEVHVNDQMIGVTPFPPKELPPGSYRVRLVNKDLSHDESFAVTVKAGEITKVRRSLAGGG